jgi:hypothetical protein
VTEKNSQRWENYEQVATYVLNQIAAQFGVAFFEGKQKVAGHRSGTRYEIDAKGVRHDGETFLIVECRRYTTSKQDQEKIGALAYRILDTGAKGGIVVSPLGLQEGAEKIASAEDIDSVILEPDSTTESFVVKFLNTLLIRPKPASARASTAGPTVILSEAKKGL